MYAYMYTYVHMYMYMYVYVYVCTLYGCVLSLAWRPDNIACVARDGQSAYQGSANSGSPSLHS